MLLAFTDTKEEILLKIPRLKRKGFTHLLLKKELGAYGLYGKQPKRRK